MSKLAACHKIDRINSVKYMKLGGAETDRKTTMQDLAYTGCTSYNATWGSLKRQMLQSSSRYLCSLAACALQ